MRRNEFLKVVEAIGIIIESEIVFQHSTRYIKHRDVIPSLHCSACDFELRAAGNNKYEFGMKKSSIAAHRDDCPLRTLLEVLYKPGMEEFEGKWAEKFKETIEKRDSTHVKKEGEDD